MNGSIDSNNINEENIFSYLSVDILSDNLKEQIEGKNSSTNIDYLQEFEDKFNFIIKFVTDNISYYDDIINKLNNDRNEFYNLAYKLVCNKFGIKYIEFSQLITIEERFQVIKALYIFFIIRIKENLINLYYNNINKNSKVIIKSYKSDINTEDLFYKLSKKEFGKDFAVLFNSIESYLNNFEINTIEDLIEDIIDINEKEEYINSIIWDVFIDLNNFSRTITIDKEKLNSTLKSLYNIVGFNCVLQVKNMIKNDFISNKEE